MEQLTTRTAACACGQLRVTVEGEPKLVNMCNCTYCQRRTGSAFGVSAYFDKAAQLVAIDGEHRAFRRSSQRGRQFEHRFCPECGSAVFWYGEMAPHLIGIAVGAFADPQFPPPSAAIWVGTKLDWIEFPHGIPALDEQRL